MVACRTTEVTVTEFLSRTPPPSADLTWGFSLRVQSSTNFASASQGFQGEEGPSFLI